jgi:hypothetical protein
LGWFDGTVRTHSHRRYLVLAGGCVAPRLGRCVRARGQAERAPLGAARPARPAARLHGLAERVGAALATGAGARGLPAVLRDLRAVLRELPAPPG